MEENLISDVLVGHTYTYVTVYAATVAFNIILLLPLCHILGVFHTI